MIATLFLISALAQPPLPWRADPVTENTISDRSAAAQSAAMDADSRAHAVWTEQAESDWRIVYAIRSQDGTWSAPIALGNSQSVPKPVIAWDAERELAYVAYAQTEESYDRMVVLTVREGLPETAYESDWGAWSANPALALYLGQAHVVWVDQAEGQPVQLRHIFTDDQGWQSQSIAAPTEPLYFEIGAQPFLSAEDRTGLNLSVRLAGAETGGYEVWAMRWSGTQWQDAARISPQGLSAYNAPMVLGKDGSLHAAINAQACWDCAHQMLYTSRTASGRWSPARLLRLPDELGIGGAYAYSLAFDPSDRLQLSAGAMAGNTLIGDILQGSLTDSEQWQFSWLRKNRYTYNTVFVQGAPGNAILAYEGMPSEPEEIVWLQPAR